MFRAILPQLALRDVLDALKLSRRADEELRSVGGLDLLGDFYIADRWTVLADVFQVCRYILVLTIKLPGSVKSHSCCCFV